MLLDEIYQVMRVTRWPTGARRLFVVLAPVSIPLWLLAWPLLVLLQIIGVLVIGLGISLRDVWVGEERASHHPNRYEDCE